MGEERRLTSADVEDFKAAVEAFNQLVRGLTLQSPPWAKVERLALARKYLERLKVEAARFRGIELERLAEVEASLDALVADYMAQGFYSEALRVPGYVPKRVDMT